MFPPIYKAFSDFNVSQSNRQRLASVSFKSLPEPLKSQKTNLALFRGAMPVNRRTIPLFQFLNGGFLLSCFSLFIYFCVCFSPTTRLFQGAKKKNRSDICRGSLRRLPTL